MKTDDINISLNFFRVLWESKINPSTYKLALYLPELFQQNNGDPINFQNISQIAEELQVSPSTVRRSIKELEMLYIIAPTGDKSSWYFCNPHLIWGDTTDELLQFNRKSWNYMIEQRLQEI